MAAQIDIAGYRLEGTAHCWIFGKLLVRETGEKAGEDYISQPKYSPTLSQALTKLLEMSLRESDAKSVVELRDHIDAFKAEIMALTEVRVREPYRRQKRRQSV